MKKFKVYYGAVAVILFALVFIVEGLISKDLTYNLPFVGYGGTFKFNDLKILFIPIYWFLMMVGLFINVALSLKTRKKYNYSIFEAILFPIIFLVISYSGAKLLYIAENFASFTKFELSGLSLFGAIYSVLLLVPVIALIFRKNILEAYDYFTPFGLILLTAVRLGCFFNGCCEAYTLWVDSMPIVLPVQLFEVALDILILDFVLRNKKTGRRYPYFMILYGINRFLLEFLRKTPKDTLFLSHGQIFALAAIILGGIMLLIICKKKK